MRQQLTRKSIQQNIFFFLLCVLVVASATSKFLMSASMCLLFANWLIEGNFKNKYQIAKNDSLLVAFFVLYAVHLVWCLFSSNWDYALADLLKKLPLLVIPLVVLTSDFLDKKKIYLLLQIYCTTIVIASVYGIIHYFYIPELEYRRIFPHFSNIRFALNVCMATIIVFFAIIKTLSINNLPHKRLKIVTLFFAELIFVVILFFLQSYTAFIILCIVAIVLILRWMIMQKKLSIYVSVIGFLFMGFAAIFWIVSTSYHDYYDLKSASIQKQVTKNGNVYAHSNDGLVEMGNFVNNNVCQKELETEWAKRSQVPIYDTTANTFTVYPTLIRYLNALGYTKDSLGISKLQQSDIKQIEKGVANPFYVKKYSVKKMIYRLFFEYEMYKNFNEIRYSSMLQRLALWENGFSIFLQNPVIGVGTGDVNDEIRAELRKNNSQLASTSLRTHNQYITLLLSFGIIGFLLIIIFFARAFRKEHLLKSPIFIAYFAIVLISFISEDTLETEAGCVFCTLIFVLLKQLYFTKNQSVTNE